jgi:hypothetical protein
MLSACSRVMITHAAIAGGWAGVARQEPELQQDLKRSTSHEKDIIITLLRDRPAAVLRYPNGRTPRRSKFRTTLVLSKADCKKGLMSFLVKQACSLELPSGTITAPPNVLWQHDWLTQQDAANPKGAQLGQTRTNLKTKGNPRGAWRAHA